MWPNPQFPADLVTFTEKILHRKLHFLCSVVCKSEVLQSASTDEDTAWTSVIVSVRMFFKILKSPYLETIPYFSEILNFKFLMKNLVSNFKEF